MNKRQIFVQSLALSLKRYLKSIKHKTVQAVEVQLIIAVSRCVDWFLFNHLHLWVCLLVLQHVAMRVRFSFHLPVENIKQCRGWTEFISDIMTPCKQHSWISLTHVFPTFYSVRLLWSFEWGCFDNMVDLNSMGCLNVCIIYVMTHDW